MSEEAEPKVVLSRLILAAIKGNPYIDSAEIIVNEQHVLAVEFSGMEFFVEVQDA